MVGRTLLVAVFALTLVVFAPTGAAGRTSVDYDQAEIAEKKDDHEKKESHSQSKAKGDHGHDKKAEGNPIFPAPIEAIDLGIWTLVVFLLLFLILTRYAWKPMLEGLHKREESIRLAVDEAKIAREETKRIQAEFQAKMDAAFAEIPKMMEEARRQAEQLRDEMKTKALADIATERQRLRREVDTARDQALQEIWNQAAQLATLISAKAIGRSLNDEDHRRLNEVALGEVRQAGEKRKSELRQFGEEWHSEGGADPS
jgi:F-type H+-transporting ATPase subunit b